MYYKTSDNLNIYYEIHGNEKSSRSLVFLNGLSQSTLSWMQILPLLKNDYKIILLDFIFQGQSDKKGEARDFDQHAADVFNLLGFLNINKVSPVGISYGSLVAQNFTVNYPEKVEKLILISSFANKTPYYEAIERAWHNAINIGGYSLLLDVMLPTVLSDNYFEHPLIPIESLKDGRQNINTELSALKKLMIATEQREDYREKLKLIKKPTLIIHGEKDALISLRMGKAVADSIEKSRFEIISTAGHTINLEAALQAAKLINEFLSVPHAN